MKENNYQSTHSTSSYINAIYDEVKTYRVQYIEELIETADRRLELLRRTKELLDIIGIYLPDDVQFWDDNLLADIRKELNG